MTNYKKISRNIRIMFAAMIALMVAIVVACEFDMGLLEGVMICTFDTELMYCLQVGMFFLTGVCVLVALKGFNWVLKNKVQTAENAERVELYTKCHFIRIALLGAPMLTGILFYYMTLENWGVYYALIALVSSFFCLPSAEGVEIELDMKEHHNS